MEARLVEIVEAALPQVPPSPAATVDAEFSAFALDLVECSDKWGTKGVLEGYVGLEASISSKHLPELSLILSDFRSMDDETVSFAVQYEDVDGRSGDLNLVLAFERESSSSITDR